MSDFVSWSSKLLTIVQQSDVEVSDNTSTLVNDIEKCIAKTNVNLADIVSNWRYDDELQEKGSYRQFREDGDKLFQKRMYLEALESYR